MRKLVLCLFAGLAAGAAWAQEENILWAALYLSGASSVEEIPADWIERLEGMHPLRVNSPHLRAGVLLSDYQVACIRDYRGRCGDILSPDELSLVDGFSAEAVAALAPFLLFTSDRLPGKTDTVRVRSSAILRTTLSSVGAKAKAWGEYWQAGAAWRGKDGSVHADAQWGPVRVLAGDFHTRWGQGLAAWTGFSMESLSTVDAFVKRSTGLSPVWSYAPSSVHRGVACEYARSRFRTAVFAAREKDFGFHGDLLWRHGQMGMTALLTQGNCTLSLDGRYNWKGIDYVGETAYRNRSFAARMAVRGKWGDSRKWAFQARVLPSRFSGKKYGEYAVAIGTNSQRRDKQLLSLTADAALLPIPGADAARFQLRVYGMGQFALSPLWLLDVRFTERYRNYEAPRTDVRADIKYSSGSWVGVLRLESDYCDDWGFLSYLEGGYKGEQSAAYIRATGFWINSWNARIYCYERDAPGTFSIPAYNGRGMMLSAVGSHKLYIGRRFSLKANLRAACQLRTDKPPAPTLNFQLQADL